MESWPVIKYNPKKRCKDEFIEALVQLKNGPNKGKRDVRFIQLASGAIAEFVNYESLGIMVDLQMTGLEWLDSVDHLLERYEDDSRTLLFQEIFSKFRTTSTGFLFDIPLYLSNYAVGSIKLMLP